MAIQPPGPDRSTLTALTDYQGTYHNHKEQLGYAAAVLYVGGAAAVVFGPDPWSSYPSWAKGLFLALVAMTGAAGLFYVFWQFRLRSIAADRIEQLLGLLPPELGLVPAVGCSWHGTSGHARVGRRRVRPGGIGARAMTTTVYAPRGCNPMDSRVPKGK